jgi:hypothetical protein
MEEAVHARRMTAALAIPLGMAALANGSKLQRKRKQCGGLRALPVAAACDTCTAQPLDRIGQIERCTVFLFLTQREIFSTVSMVCRQWRADSASDWFVSGVLRVRWPTLAPVTGPLAGRWFSCVINFGAGGPRWAPPTPPKRKLKPKLKSASSPQKSRLSRTRTDSSGRVREAAGHCGGARAAHATTGKASC